jgi:dihydrofolate reductase
VFIATSLDGFIAREDGSIDWLEPPAGQEMADHGYDRFRADIDVLVMGRATFQTVLSFDVPWPFGTRQVVFLSSAPVVIPPELSGSVESMDGEPAEILAALAARGFSHAYVDGGATIQRFLEGGLIERLIITRIPILLGAGIPLFGPLSRDVRWQHVATRSFEGGLVQSEYTRQV